MLSRRSLLAASLGVTLAACSGSRPRITEAEASRAVADVEDALRSADESKIAQAVTALDNEWRGRLAVARSGRVDFRVVPRLDTLVQGENPTVSGRLENSIHDGDAATVAQPFTCRLERSATGWSVRDLAVDSTVVALPWDVGATQSWSTEHLVLFAAPTIASSVEALLAPLEQTAAKAFQDVPGHGITQRVVTVVADKLPDRNGLGGFSSTPEAFGYVAPVEGTAGAVAYRALLTRMIGDENLAQMLRHELVHVLTFGWAPRTGLGAQLVTEGVAYWAENNFADGLIPFIRKFQIVPVDVIDTGVAHRLEFPVGTQGDDTKHAVGKLYLQAAFHAWLETRLGREATWQLARECFEGNDHLRTYARALALGTFEEVAAEFGRWARPALLV